MLLKEVGKIFYNFFYVDWLYPTSENREIVIALNAAGADVGFIEITSDKGHDSFLLDVPDFLNSVKNFLEAKHIKIFMKQEFKIISELIEENKNFRCGVWRWNAYEVLER